MIKIKNNGNKIVHIGKTALMPGDEITVNDRAGKTPAIYALAKNKILTITETTDSTVAAEIAETPAETPTETGENANTVDTGDTADTTEIATDETTTKKTTLKKTTSKKAAATE